MKTLESAWSRPNSALRESESGRAGDRPGRFGPDGVDAGRDRRTRVTGAERNHDRDDQHAQAEPARARAEQRARDETGR